METIRILARAALGLVDLAVLAVALFAGLAAAFLVVVAAAFRNVFGPRRRIEDAQASAPAAPAL